jgi:hypothetical protein
MVRLASAVLLGSFAVACSAREAPTSSSSVAPTTTATASLNVVEALRLRFSVVEPESGLRVSVIPTGAALGFLDDGRALTPKLANGAVPNAILPARADRAFVVRAGSTSIEATPHFALPVNARPEGSALVYQGAVEGGSIVHVPLADGTEEIIELASPPKDGALRYELKLHNAAGLRLVESRILEVLTSDGNPVLRTQAPVVIDSRGRRVEGSIDIEGCNVDRSPAPPWGRAMTPAGAERCTLVARFESHGLAYPVLVDPAWTTTASMAGARGRHRAMHIKSCTGSSNGCVLVTGGVNASGTYLNTAEVWNYATKAWAATGSMTTARSNHAAAAYDTNTIGLTRATVAGGSVSASAATGLAETWSSTTGTWAASGSMAVGRSRTGFAHFSGSLSYLYVVGGYEGSAVSTRVERFGSTTSGGTWGAVASLPVGVVSPVTIVDQSANRLYVGGGQLGSGTGSANVYYLTGLNTTAPTWSTGPSLTKQRKDLAGVQIGTTILFAGGRALIGGLQQLDNTIDALNTTSLTIAPYSQTLSVARENLEGVVTTSGGVSRFMFLGGKPSTGVSTRGDVFTTAGIGGITDMSQARSEHQATTLTPNGAVLVTGGFTGSTGLPATTSVELFEAMPLGSACTKAGDCASVACVDGVCCYSTCLGQCQACNIAGSVGTCTTVTLTNAPTGYGAGEAISRSGTTRAACTGYGTSCGSRCTGASATACTPTADGTTCTAASCAGGIETKSSTCLAGGCQTPMTTECRPYLCGTTTCLSACTTNAQCSTGYKCEASKCVPAGTAGSPCATPTDCNTGLSCVDSVCCSTSSCTAPMKCNVAGSEGSCKLDKGAPCTTATASSCGTGLCVDGVCCNSVCGGTCEACDVPGAAGTCTAVTGAPRGGRPACFDGGGDVCRVLGCDGVDRTKCAAYANGLETVCKPASCAAGVLKRAAVCDGKGACGSATDESCAPYVCDGTDKCKTSCATTDDCANGFRCANGSCSAITAECSSDGTQSVALDGKTPPRACAPYKCDPASGNCFDKCATSDQCATGSVCDGTACAAAPAAGGASEDSGGCAVGTRATSGLELIAFAALAVALKRRRAR